MAEEELHLKYRPKKFDEVLGQEAAVKVLKKGVENGNLPHSVLLTGTSGTGKTTLARITAKELLCVGQNLREINCANFRGIDTVRDIQSTINLAPLGGKTIVYIIDEAHKLTNEAQNGILKVLEEPPKHVYFFLCTTEPGKLITAIKTRVTEVKTKPLPEADMKSLIARTCKLEKIKLGDEVEDKIKELSEGSARKILVLLGQIRNVPEAEQESILISAETNAKAIDLARIMFKRGAQWGEAVELLKVMEDEPETVRRVILGYASSILLSAKSIGFMQNRADFIIGCFQDNFYDSGKAGLISRCFEVFKAK